MADQDPHTLESYSGAEGPCPWRSPWSSPSAPRIAGGRPMSTRNLTASLPAAAKKTPRAAAVAHGTGRLCAPALEAVCRRDLLVMSTSGCRAPRPRLAAEGLGSVRGQKEREYIQAAVQRARAPNTRRRASLPSVIIMSTGHTRPQRLIPAAASQRCAEGFTAAAQRQTERARAAAGQSCRVDSAEPARRTPPGCARRKQRNSMNKERGEAKARELAAWP